MLDRSDGTYRRFTRTAGGATIAPEETLPAAAAAEREGDAWQQAVEEVELLAETGGEHDQSLFLDGVTTPVLFASAVSNFGVGALLDTLVGLAPPPAAQPDADGGARALTDPFSAFVFKVQAGMDTAHRDRLAFIRICSGVFERGMVVTHAAHRPAVRDQVRPARVRPGAGEHRPSPTPATSSAWSTPPPSASATRSTPTGR